VERTLISNNQVTGPIAQHGGGVLLYAVQTPMIINSTVSGNYSSNAGGGIAADFAYVASSTIAGNSTHAADSTGSSRKPAASFSCRTASSPTTSALPATST
jgi:hypothetical protein